MLMLMINLFLLKILAESKLDSTFPKTQFKMNGFKNFEHDRNRFGGGLLLHVNDKMPSKFFSSIFQH